MGIVKVVKDLIKMFDKKCSFCGSRKNVKSTIILTMLYYYCDKKSCRDKILAMEKRRRKITGK